MTSFWEPSDQGAPAGGDERYELRNVREREQERRLAAAGCNGCCGGVESACVEPEGSVTHVSWEFVGRGQGGFDPVNTYSFIGHGQGSYERKEIVTPTNFKVRPIWFIATGVLVLLGAIAYFFPVRFGGSGQSDHSEADRASADSGTARSARPVPNQTDEKSGVAATSAFDCSSGQSEAAWPANQKDWCCRHAGRACAPQPGQQAAAAALAPPPAPAGAEGGEAVTDPPPAPRAAEEVAPVVALAAPAPYDCAEGFQTWQAGWEAAKKAWCCSQEGKGCVAVPPARLRRL